MTELDRLLLHCAALIGGIHKDLDALTRELSIVQQRVAALTAERDRLRAAVDDGVEDDETFEADG